jgi:two-component system, OmpR family, sensor kinase
VRELVHRAGLRGRLIALIAGLLIAALAVTGVLVYRGTGAQVRRAVDADLRDDAAAFSSQAVSATARSPAQVAAGARRYLSTRPGFGAKARLFIVRVAGGPVLTNRPELTLGAGADPDQEPAGVQSKENTGAAALRSAGSGLATFNVPDAGKLRVLTRPVVRAGRTVATVSVGESLAAVQQAQSGVVSAFLLAGSLVLVAAVALGAVLATRLVRPLREMAATAAEIDAGDLSHRIHAQGPRDEMRVLADAFDHMLDRLEDAFARQRAFVADASHELRTPLTVIRGQLEVLARQEHADLAEVRRTERTARVELVRMERLINDLLVLARADEGVLVSPREVRLEPFVEEVRDGLVETADRRFELAGHPSGTVRADPDRLRQALYNLLGNAIEYTRPGGLVRLVVEPRDGTVELAVEDDGPGIAVAERDRVFDRFHRADAHRGPGAGLGLSIVRAIAEAHGGSVAATASPEGGGRVAMTLPGWRS